MSVHDRRSFISLVASVTGLSAVAPLSRAEAAQPKGPAAQQWDLSWLDAMKGDHKQIYDLGSHDLVADPRPLRLVRNFVETFGEVYGVDQAKLSTVVGISGKAFPMNATDRLWAKYKLGERFHIVDPTTKQPSVRNIFYEGNPFSVQAIQALGTVFCQCNRALGGVAQELAAAEGLPVAEVRADLIAGLNPGVRLVPAHVMVIALAHERGFSYAKS